MRAGGLGFRVEVWIFFKCSDLWGLGFRISGPEVKRLQFQDCAKHSQVQDSSGGRNETEE